MKSGYKTIPKEEESKPLTKAGITETGGSGITKKYLVLVSLGLVIMGFLMGHRTNTQHSGLRMSQESMTVQLMDFNNLVDSKEDNDVSTRSPPWVHTTKMATNQEKELLLESIVSYSLEVVHCHPSSVDILECKCSSSPLIRWLQIRTRNCWWNGFVSYSLEVVHCHPFSVDILGC